MAAGDADVCGELFLAWGDVVGRLRHVSDAEAWLPTGCTGWSVRDLVFHLLADAQRALVAFGTPRDTPADTDAVSYWRDWQPDSDRAQDNLRMTRIAASVYPGFAVLLDEYEETTLAATTVAARCDPDSTVGTQGHVLRVADLVRTLVVEAAVHHLDLVGALDTPGPGDSALAVVRETLDGLLGRPLPLDWDDTTYARTGTGRAALAARDRTALGSLADRFPLFG